MRRRCCRGLLKGIEGLSLVVDDRVRGGFLLVCCSPTHPPCCSTGTLLALANLVLDVTLWSPKLVVLGEFNIWLMKRHWRQREWQWRKLTSEADRTLMKTHYMAYTVVMMAAKKKFLAHIIAPAKSCPVELFQMIYSLVWHISVNCPLWSICHLLCLIKLIRLGWTWTSVYHYRNLMYRTLHLVQCYVVYSLWFHLGIWTGSLKRLGQLPVWAILAQFPIYHSRTRWSSEWWPYSANNSWRRLIG